MGTMHAAWVPYPVVSYSLSSRTSNWSSISSQSGFTIIAPNNERKRIKDTHLFIRAKGKQVYLNGSKLEIGNYIILPQSLTILIDGALYAGPLSLRITADKLCMRARQTQDQLSLFNAEIPLEQKILHRYMVRVLLDDMNINDKDKSWSVGSDNGFIIWDPEKQKQKNNNHEEIQVCYKRNALYLNKNRFDQDRVHLIPKQGFASIDGVPYHGSFMFVRDGERILLINMVELEEYVYCVLRTESWPGWPLEVNKAFAIASRSYVMAQMKTARKKKLPYHVKNTNEHQTYQGMHNCLTSRAAVEQTRGVFLAYNNEAVLAMFDSCCGGIIPAHIDDFDFGKAAYLKRSYPCKHCKKCKLYSWQAEFEQEEFHDQMERLLAIDGIKEVKIAQKDKAGLVKTVAVKTGDEQGILTGQQFYRLFKEIKSFHFDMKQKSNKLIMTGRGYGHHLGLCQWGAREMVRDGWPYTRILQFYYPGTQFLRLPS